MPTIICLDCQKTIPISKYGRGTKKRCEPCQYEHDRKMHKKRYLRRMGRDKMLYEKTGQSESRRAKMYGAWKRLGLPMPEEET